MSDSAHSTNHQQVDGIYVVNLDVRPERWAQFQAGAESWTEAFGPVPVRLSAVPGVELEGYGKPPWFRTRIKERRRKSWAGKAGCILSHRKAIGLAQGRGWGSVLIVEDDAFLTNEMVQAWASGVAGMVASLPPDWAAVYLYTADPIPPCRSVGEAGGIRLVEAMGAFGTVAYLLNGRIFGKLQATLPAEKGIWRWVARYKAIDLWFSRNLRRFGRVYVVAPSLVGHQVGPSDITVTPESEWTFNGLMEDLACTSNPTLFAIKKAMRSLEWVWQECVAFLRMNVKRLRGL